MFNSNPSRNKFRELDGITYVPNWMLTFRSLAPGEERVFQRTTITTQQARGVATKLNKTTSMRFSVRAGEYEEYCTVRRER